MMDSLIQLKNNLMTQFKVDGEGVLLIHEYPGMNHLSGFVLYQELSTLMNPGTLGIFGDVSLNEHVASHPFLKSLSTQERMVLGSGVQLQLLTLDARSKFAAHPSHLLGFKGKYANYLARSLDLDYPYGPVSIYNDLYDMDAIILHLGVLESVPELRHVFAKRKDAIIQKNTAQVQGRVVEFLDYDCDDQILKEKLIESGLVHEFEYQGTKIYAYAYQEVIDALRLMDELY